MKFKILTVYISTYKEGGLRARVQQAVKCGYTYGSDLLRGNRTSDCSEATTTVIEKLCGLTERIYIRYENKLEQREREYVYPV